MLLKNCLYFMFLMGLTPLPGFAQKISKVEKQILKNVEKNHEEAVQFLEKTVNINSGTFNADGVKQVAVLYRELLEEIEFSTDWIDMPAEMERAGHLVGEIKGKKGKKLLLLGHMDTVFEPDSPFQTWKVQDSIATGPGVIDMKGGNMIMLYALKALKETGLLKDRQIIVMLHGDEENSGDPKDISRRDVIEAAKRSDIALCFEPSTGFGYATIARRGISHWKLNVSGKQAHSSGVFTERVGAGAIYETSRILHRFYDELQEEYLTYNPGIIVGGSEVGMDSKGIQGTVSGKFNIVANTTLVNGDLRFLSEEQKERTREKMRAIVAESLPETQAEITFEEGFPAMPPTEGNKEVLAVLNQVSIDLGHGEVKAYDPGKRGAGDISFVAQYLDCLDGLGAMGGGSHAPEEYLNLNTLEDLVKRVAVLIYRLTKLPEGEL